MSRARHRLRVLEAAAFLGLTALDEHLRTHGLGLLVVGVSVVVMCVATVALCRTSAVSG